MGSSSHEGERKGQLGPGETVPMSGLPPEGYPEGSRRVWTPQEEHFPLVEFAYNNSYQASIQMAPYEALYGRPCRSPLCWTEVGESSITGPDLIRDTSEKVSLIRQRLLTAQSR